MLELPAVLFRGIPDRAIGREIAGLQWLPSAWVHRVLRQPNKQRRPLVGVARWHDHRVDEHVLGYGAHEVGWWLAGAGIVGIVIGCHSCGCCLLVCCCGVV